MAASGLHGDQPGVGTPGSGFEANRPAIIAPSVLTPINGDELAEDIPLILDLGPEPALTDSLTRARSWFGGERPAKVPGTADFPPGESEPSYVLSRGPRAAARLTLVLGNRRTPFSGDASAGRVCCSARMVANPQSPASVVVRPRPTVPKTVEAKAEPPIVVVTTNGEEKPIPDLSEAVNVAIGSGGWVVLRNRDPLRLSAAKQPDLPAPPGGWFGVAGRRGGPDPVLDRRPEGGQSAPDRRAARDGN